AVEAEAAVRADDVLHLHLPLGRELGEVSGGEPHPVRILDVADLGADAQREGRGGPQRRDLDRRRRRLGPALAGAQRQRRPDQAAPAEPAHRPAAARRPSSSSTAPSRRARSRASARRMFSATCSYFFCSSKASARMSRAPASSCWRGARWACSSALRTRRPSSHPALYQPPSASACEAWLSATASAA